MQVGLQNFSLGYESNQLIYNYFTFNPILLINYEDLGLKR